MRPRQEGFCLGLTAALGAFILLHALPVGRLLLPAERIPARPAASYERNVLRSPSGLVVETVSFAHGPARTLALVFDATGDPVDRFDGAKAVGWSPAADLLLLQDTDSGGGYRIADLRNRHARSARPALVHRFGQGQDLGARFTAQGELLLHTREGDRVLLAPRAILRHSGGRDVLALVSSP